MTRSAFLNVLPVVIVSFALAVTPQSGFAQRGFHGGGGFHGGSFGGGFHNGFGGRSFGGFRGGTFGGFRGGRLGGFRGDHFGFRGGFGRFGGRGLYGWRGRGWGYPYYGYGWGLNIGFGLWPYWGGYPYYDYGPGWGPYAYNFPSYYPYYPEDPDDGYYDRERRDQPNRPDYRHDPEFRSKPPANAPKPNAQPSNGTGSAHSPNSDDTNLVFALYRSTDSKGSHQVTRPRYAYEPIQRTSDASVERLRPAVRSAIQALRAMPPGARERQLNSGRYSNFSALERQLLKAQFEPAQAQ